MSLETPLDVGPVRLRISQAPATGRHAPPPGNLAFDRAVTDGIWWSPHLWLGSIVLCGIVGWLLSYLVVPPRTSAARR